jgi:hypothetical protein
MWEGQLITTMCVQPRWAANRLIISASPRVVLGSGMKQKTWAPAGGREHSGGAPKGIDITTWSEMSLRTNVLISAIAPPSGSPRTTIASALVGLSTRGLPTTSMHTASHAATRTTSTAPVIWIHRRVSSVRTTQG